MQIQSYNNYGSYTRTGQTFAGGKHVYGKFSSLMNHLYDETQKQCRGQFTCPDTIYLTATTKKFGTLSGCVNFSNGKYAGLVMDEAFKDGPYRQEFIRTILEKYNKSVATSRVARKLGYGAE